MSLSQLENCNFFWKCHPGNWKKALPAEAWIVAPSVTLFSKNNFINAFIWWKVFRDPNPFNFRPCCLPCRHRWSLSASASIPALWSWRSPHHLQGSSEGSLQLPELQLPGAQASLNCHLAIIMNVINMFMTNNHGFIFNRLKTQEEHATKTALTALGGSCHSPRLKVQPHVGQSNSVLAESLAPWRDVKIKDQLQYFDNQQLKESDFQISAIQFKQNLSQALVCVPGLKISDSVAGQTASPA